MAEETNTEKAETKSAPAQTQSTDVSIFREELKPVPKWKTFLAKANNIALMVFSTAIIAGGVYTLVNKGGKAQDLLDDIANNNDANEISAKVMGTILTSIGAAGLLTNAVSLSADNGAIRARNFVKVQEDLDAMLKAKGAVKG